MGSCSGVIAQRQPKSNSNSGSLSATKNGLGRWKQLSVGGGRISALRAFAGLAIELDSDVHLSRLEPGQNPVIAPQIMTPLNENE